MKLQEAVFLNLTTVSTIASQFIEEVLWVLVLAGPLESTVLGDFSLGILSSDEIIYGCPVRKNRRNRAAQTETGV